MTAVREGPGKARGVSSTDRVGGPAQASVALASGNNTTEMPMHRTSVVHVSCVPTENNTEPNRSIHVGPSSEEQH